MSPANAKTSRTNMLNSYEENQNNENNLNDNQEQGSEDTNLSNTEDKNSVADEARIPYSRFETVHERAIRAEAELEILRRQAEQAQAQSSQDQEPPSDWLELYGDTEESRNSYKKVLAMDADRADRIYQEVQNKMNSEKSQSQAKIEHLNNKFDQAEAELGKQFSEEELLGIMGIMEEFTPKDENGNFLSELIDPAKAYEVYQMRHKTVDNSRSQARKQVLKTINGSSNGNTNSGSADLGEYTYRGQWRTKYEAD